MQRWFARFGKHIVAMLCIAQCLVLSGQAAMATVDRIDHLFQVTHAPNAVAGSVVMHGEHVYGVQHHDHGAATHHSGAQSHCHVGDGAMSAWDGVSATSLVQPDATPCLSAWRVATPPDAPVSRQDRPPKHNSEALI